MTLAIMTASTLSLAAENEGDSVTPYRPTLSNPAELSAPGKLEIEAGILKTRAASERQQTLPYTAKLAIDQQWGVMIGGDALIRNSNSAEQKSGQGDTNFTLKRYFAGSEKASIGYGLEAGFKAPTARKGLGSGQADWTLNSIISLDLSDTWRLDSNLGVTKLGRHSIDEGGHSTLFATALSKSIGPWTPAIEWAEIRQQGVNSKRQGLIAVTYLVTRRLAVDFGVARSHQGELASNALFMGFSWLSSN
jgi:hypothetical protein